MATRVVAGSGGGAREVIRGRFGGGRAAALRTADDHGAPVVLAETAARGCLSSDSREPTRSNAPQTTCRRPAGARERACAPSSGVSAFVGVPFVRGPATRPHDANRACCPGAARSVPVAAAGPSTAPPPNAAASARCTSSAAGHCLHVQVAGRGNEVLGRPGAAAVGPGEPSRRRTPRSSSSGPTPPMPDSS